MKLKKLLRKILEQHHYPQDAPDDVLFKLLSPYCLHKTMAQGSPYLENSEGASEAYVTKCVEIAVGMYHRLNFGSELIIVYEDFYSENNQGQIRFVEGCLDGMSKTESYSFSWKHRPMEETYPAARTNNSDIYTCTRSLYEVKDIDTQRLFKEIILSDIGGQYDLVSKIFIIDLSTSCIFHLYDDRGLWVSAPEGISFPQLGTENDEASDDEYEDIVDAEICFSILYEDFQWIDGAEDDPEDLCLHGTVSVLMGTESFAYHCCVSAAALRMLKTLTENHEVTNSGEQMLPCCGDSMIADETMETVTIIGCDNGIDWTVRHEDGGIQLITATGKQVLVDKARYRKEVFRFADAVENFYKNASPKIFPSNNIDREGYQVFWKEWRKRRAGVLVGPGNEN